MPTRISVLLPVFNAEATLAACLESILGQTFADFEVIAVNDGSDDGTAGVLAQFIGRDSRLRVVAMEHEGIVAALNRGLAACSAPFVARMDADDLMEPARLEKQFRFMEQTPGCDLVGTLIEPFRVGGTPSPGMVRFHGWMNSLVTDAEIRAAQFIDLPIAHPTFFARRAWFERLGGYRDCPWVEDYDLFLRAAGSGAAFGKVPEVLVYRGDGEGRLTRHDPRCGREALYLAKCKYLVEHGWLDGKDGVVVAGTGPSGRFVAEELARQGAAIRAFIDNREGPPGRTVMEIPAHGFSGEIPGEIFQAHRDAFFVLCIGEPDGRAQFLARLESLGFNQGRDFTRFI